MSTRWPPPATRHRRSLCSSGPSSKWVSRVQEREFRRVPTCAKHTQRTTWTCAHTYAHADTTRQCGRNICVHMHAHAHTTPPCGHARTHACTHVDAYTHVHMHGHTQMHPVDIYTREHAHEHTQHTTRTYTQVCTHTGARAMHHMDVHTRVHMHEHNAPRGRVHTHGHARCATWTYTHTCTRAHTREPVLAPQCTYGNIG